MDAESVSQVQRKIELQSPDDLSFLLANTRRGAAARLDEAFPPVARARGSGSEPDELRDRIAALVDAYVARTFALSAPNLSINGLPVPPHLLLPDQQAPRPRPRDAAADALYEPFDARKRQRVAVLVAAEERLLEDVAALKRRVPAAAAAAHAARLRDAVARDDASAQPPRPLAHHHYHLPPLALAPLPRQPAVAAGFGAAVDALAALQRDLPAVVAKVERARVAADYAVAAEPS